MAQQQRAAGAPTPSPPLDEGSVADFLLKKKYFLSALELHQELQEGNNGMHSVGALNKFFNDGNTYASLVKRVADEEAKNQVQSFGGKTASIQSPFASDGLQPALAARDQKIALLEYRLRCAEEESERTRGALLEAVAALQVQPGKEGGAQVPGSTGPSSSLSSSSSRTPPSAPLSADEEGGRITPSERRTINALIRRYLLARGYKATAVALAEEVADQDLSGRTDDTSLLALPGSGRRVGGGAAPVLTLLGMQRQRIAPIQAQLAESERRTDSEVSAVRAELRAVHEQMDGMSAELRASQARVGDLEGELMHARTVRGAGQGGAGGAQAHAPGAAGALAAPGSVPPASSPAPSTASLSGKITMAHAPALLKSVVDGLPTLARITVSRQRVALAPLLAHAACAEPSVEGRRALILSFLTLLRRPTYAERHVLRVQWGVLAAKLGGGGCEQELLPEVVLLAKTGKSKEKRALAAALAGALSAHVSDKRADTLLACLADLADSRHAIVRVGVVEGLAAVATTLAERWHKALSSGVVAGQGSAVEAFASRQFSAVEESMWRVVLGGERRGEQVEGGEHGAPTAAAEAEELSAANEAEFALNIPASLALSGTPAGEAAEKASAVAAAQAAKTGKGQVVEQPPPGSGPAALPASWFTPPTSVLGAACASLVPVLVPWAYRLGALWSRVLPGWLAIAEETLYTPGHGAPVLTPAPGAPAPSVKATTWHARRVGAVLRVLFASSIRIKQALFDSGYALTYTGPLDAPPAAGPGGGEEVGGAAAVAQPSNPLTDYLYELFDNAGGSSVTVFPPELPLVACVRGGVAVYPPGTHAGQHGAGLLPPQHRQALVLAALLRGTASVRRRRNASCNPATLPPGSPVWQVLPDQHALVTWPALQWTMRTLLPTLVRHAACINRSSGAGREIVDAYAAALSALGSAFGGPFTSYALRPVFLRAFGVPCELPPPPPAPGAAPLPMPIPGLPQPLVLALQPGVGGRAPSLLPLAQVLLGVPAVAADARKAAMAAAVGNFAGPLNYASAGPKGGDWPYVLPELQWLNRDSPENPCHAGKKSTELADMLSKRQAAIAAAPAPTAPGVPASIVTERLGGAWNADALLPVFGSGVLACPALTQREHLDHALRALVGQVALNKQGWGQLQSTLEDVVMRAGGGSSSVTASGGAPPSPSSTGHTTGGGGAATASSLLVSLPTSDPVALAAAEHAAAGVANLSHILSEVLPRMAGATDPAIRACAAGLLRSIIPLLAPRQIADPWLPCVKKLTQEVGNPTVVRAAVRALSTIYSTPSANDPEVRGLVNGEITSLLSNGPKDVILEVLRSLMRAVPQAPPATREGFILDRLLEMTERVAGAAEAGSLAMRELVDQIGDVDAGDVHNAAAQAVRATRNAAIEGAAPWPGARADDLEDVSMVLCEAFRAYGSCVVSGETKGMIREAGARLLKADLLEPSYRDMMRVTLSALFPVPAAPGLLLSPVAGHYPPTAAADAYTGLEGGGYEGQGGYGYDPASTTHTHSGSHADIMAQFAAEREAGIAPLSFDPSLHGGGGGAGGGGGGLDDSFDQAAKALGSTLTSALRGVTLKGTIGPGMGGLTMGSMGMGSMGMGSMGMGSMGMGSMGKGMFGMGSSSAGAGGKEDRPPAGKASGTTPGGKERRQSRTNGVGEEEGPATFSLSSFASGPSQAATTGPSSRRNSGASGQASDASSLNMNAFLSSAAPPQAPSSGGGGLLKGISMPGMSKHGGGGEAGGAAPPVEAGVKKPPASKGGFGDRMRKLGDAMEKAAEKIMD